MEHANCVTLVGQQYAIKEEKPIVELSIMQLHKLLKEPNTICQLIYGVLAF
jgi:hypothetical protein